MIFQPCWSLVRIRNVFLSSATFDDDTRVVAFQKSGSSFCHEYRSLSTTDYPHLDVSKFLCIPPEHSVITP
jgi:hypothetical protein